MLEDELVPEVDERQESHQDPLRNRTFFAEMLKRKRLSLVIVVLAFIIVLIIAISTSWAMSPSGFQYGNTMLWKSTSLFFLSGYKTCVRLLGSYPSGKLGKNLL